MSPIIETESMPLMQINDLAEKKEKCHLMLHTWVNVENETREELA